MKRGPPPQVLDAFGVELNFFGPFVLGFQHGEELPSMEELAVRYRIALQGLPPPPPPEFSGPWTVPPWFRGHVAVQKLHKAKEELDQAQEARQRCADQAREAMARCARAEFEAQVKMAQLQEELREQVHMGRLQRAELEPEEGNSIPQVEPSGGSSNDHQAVPETPEVSMLKSRKLGGLAWTHLAEPPPSPPKVEKDEEAVEAVGGFTKEFERELKIFERSRPAPVATSESNKSSSRRVWVTGGGLLWLCDHCPIIMNSSAQHCYFADWLLNQV